MELLFREIVDELIQCPEVEAIALAGSKVTSYEDQLSDHNFYVYLNAELSHSTRKRITNKYLRYVEFNNQYWETEDDGQLNDGSEIRLIYRDINSFDQNIAQVAIEHSARIGYTTSFWYNLLHAEILFDRNQLLEGLQQKYKIPYPAELKAAILQKNHGLLRRQMPAYIFQMQKAVTRKDLIALNHVVSNYFASYFDILFAVNEKLHPGEKKLVEYVKNRCLWIPGNFEADIETILQMAATADEKLVDQVNSMIEELDHCIRQAGRHFADEI